MKKYSFSLIKRGITFSKKYIKYFFAKNRFVLADIPRLSIETTNICDAKCIFCANRSMKRQRVHLEMSKFKLAVGQFREMGGIDIDFNAVIGDPLLDPFLLERARFVKQFPEFKSLGFLTNLEWLHLFDINEFFESGINWLGISAVLSGRGRYLEFFGVDRYNIFLENLLLLIRENKKRNYKINIYIDLKPTNEPIDEILNHPDFQKVSSLFAQDLVSQVKNRSFYVDDWQGRVALPVYLKKRPVYLRSFRPCAMLYCGLIVFSNGKVGVCACRDFEADSELILGELGIQTIAQVWKGKKLAEILFNWRKKNKIPDICRKCKHYLY